MKVGKKPVAVLNRGTGDSSHKNKYHRKTEREREWEREREGEKQNTHPELLRSQKVSV